MSIIAHHVNWYLWVWFLWLAVFYGVWAWLVLAKGNSQFSRSAMADHALRPALGNYVLPVRHMVATRLSFPVLVLLFKIPTRSAGNFQFAIQSIGMVSAAIFIISRQQPLAWSMLKGAMLGAVIGLPFGIFFFAPIVLWLWIKLIFAIIWASFGVLHLYRLSRKSLRTPSRQMKFDEHWDFRVELLSESVLPSVIVSVTGVGIEMMLYARSCCSVGLTLNRIPSAVVLIGFTSALGIGIKPNDWSSAEVYGNGWQQRACVPLGAPSLPVVISLDAGRLCFLASCALRRTIYLDL